MIVFWFHDESTKGSFHYHLNQRLHRFHTSVFGIPMVIASPVTYLKFWSNPRYSWNCFISKSETFKDLLDFAQKKTHFKRQPTSPTQGRSFSHISATYWAIIWNWPIITYRWPGLTIENDCLSNKLMTTKHYITNNIIYWWATSPAQQHSIVKHGLLSQL